MGNSLKPELLRAALDIAYDCARCADADTLRRICDDVFQLLPFRQAALAYVEKHGSQVRMVHYLNHSFDAKWTAYYSSENFEKVDPIVQYAVRHSDPFHWEESIRAGLVDPGKMKEFFICAMDHNMLDGISHGVSGPLAGEGTTLLSCETGMNAMPSHAKTLLHYVVPHIHEAYTRLLRENLLQPAAGSLSPREVEVLKWAKDGKSSWEIASILKISERTIKFHYVNIFRKLGAVNRSQAVARALSRGYI
jgi:LuxR family quorum sensing-dependent transcriptional regulator